MLPAAELRAAVDRSARDDRRPSDDSNRWEQAEVARDPRALRISYTLAKRCHERVERRPVDWRDLPPAARLPSNSLNY